jgi:hypothetical protein
MELRVLSEGHSALILAENHDYFRGVNIGVQLFQEVPYLDGLVGAWV